MPLALTAEPAFWCAATIFTSIYALWRIKKRFQVAILHDVPCHFYGAFCSTCTAGCAAQRKVSVAVRRRMFV